MIELLTRIPFYKLAKLTGSNPPLPINYTLGLTYKCQARCATCDIHSRRSNDEMTLSEWNKVFYSLGTSPYWVTFTGGEPFLYGHIREVYYRLVDICKPKMVNIPTNGQATGLIIKCLQDIASYDPKTEVTINVSIDHCSAEKNDEIRGIAGYTTKANETILAIEDLQQTCPNIKLGIHTVISKHNVNDFRAIQGQLRYWIANESNYITEIAENRRELNTLEHDITPTATDYARAVQPLIDAKMPHALKSAFRREYYRNVIKVLNKQKTIPCYAGFASCQITPDGEIWGCCIKANTIGNIRQANYQFGEVWHSEQADKIREDTRNCYCPMANVSYTNMLMDFRTMFRIAKELVR